MCLEVQYHRGGEEGGREVDGEPGQSRANRVVPWSRDLLVLRRAGEAQDVLRGLHLDGVEHVVERDVPEQPPDVIHDRHRNEIVVREQPRDLLLIRLRAHGGDVGAYERTHPLVRRGADQRAKRAGFPVDWPSASVTKTV